MLAKISTVSVVVVLVMALAVFLSPSADGTQLDPGVILRVQAAGIRGDESPQHLGSDAVARASAIAALDAPLFPASRIGDYPANYAGLVNYAWKLPRRAELANLDEWAYELRAMYAVEIPHHMLQPGDVLTNARAGTFGHALVFAQWSNPASWATFSTDRAAARDQFAQGVPFIAYEVDRFNVPARVVQRHYLLKLRDGAMTIGELDRDLTGPYFAWRNNQIAGSAEMLAPVAMKYTTSAHTVTARFSILNRGGAPVTLKNITVVSYGPDALHQGLAGTTTNFPEIAQVILQPGQVYQYQETRTFQQTGTYFALARFQVNGAAHMPAQGAYFQIVVK